MTTETGISDRRAQAILERAAELDAAQAEHVSIATLRAAARDAGISESSFDAALSEDSAAGARANASGARQRWVVRGLAGVGSAGLLLLGVAFLSRIFP